MLSVFDVSNFIEFSFQGAHFLGPLFSIFSEGKILAIEFRILYSCVEYFLIFSWSVWFQSKYLFQLISISSFILDGKDSDILFRIGWFWPNKRAHP
jgi:hypothetical protein